MKNRGFTLVELMVAMGIAGILIALIFAVYTRMSVAYQAQNQITDINQNLRSAQNRIVSELRLAGAGIASGDLYLEDPPGVNYPDPDSSAYTLVPPGPKPEIFNGAGWNGLKTSRSFTYPGQLSGYPLRPVYVVDGGTTEPDELTLLFADFRKVLGIEAISITGTEVTLTWRDGQTNDFEVGDLVMVINPRLIPTTADINGDATPETYDRTESESCLLQLSSINGGARQLIFTFAAPYNTFNDLGGSGPHHCDAVRDHHLSDVTRPIGRADTYISTLGVRGYRISPSDRDIGILQVRREARPTDAGFTEGVLFAPWQDLGIGFTNLQVATQWYEPRDTSDDDNDSANVDPDNNPELDWKSADNQETPKVYTPASQSVGVPVRLTLTLETRSLEQTNAVPTKTLPELQISSPPSATDTNNLGNLPEINLPVGGDPRYNGDYTFRRSTITVELRSSAAGRF